MTQKLKAGDKVEWETSQGKTSGTVKKKIDRTDENQRPRGCGFRR